MTVSRFATYVRNRPCYNSRDGSLLGPKEDLDDKGLWSKEYRKRYAAICAPV